jgi:GTP-binding protein Era
MDDTFRSGFIALIGRPNVGKSTLLNALLGQRISIVTDRQQTTRNRIRGIKTDENAQMIFVDTPGIHSPRHALGASMVKATQEALREIDLIAFITDSGKMRDEDETILSMLKGLKKPVIFILNKADRKSPSEITEVMRVYDSLFPFAAFLSLSALKGKGISLLREKLREFLPVGPKYYDDEMVTDQYERFMASEIIREKIIKNTAEEVPHASAVEILEWKEKKEGLVSISAAIYVEREGQKGIIIGKKGEMLKTIGRQARLDIESLIGAKVFLELWVKVKRGWRDDKRMLHELGYE